MTWTPELDELARRSAMALQMGGADKVQRQHDGGRLTVRERITQLLDASSFHEVGALSGIGEYDAAGTVQEIEARLNALRSAFRSAEKFWVEEIIDPRRTRSLLCDFARLAEPLRVPGRAPMAMRP